MKAVRSSFTTALIAWAMARGAVPARAQQTSATQATAPQSVQVPLYTDAQAERGKEVYERTCASCHDTTAFTGNTFRTGWTGQSVGRLYTFIRTMMPHNNPGTLTDQQYADIVSYIVQLNGNLSGKHELPPDPDALAAFPLEFH